MRQRYILATFWFFILIADSAPVPASAETAQNCIVKSRTVDDDGDPEITLKNICDKRVLVKYCDDGRQIDALSGSAIYCDRQREIFDKNITNINFPSFILRSGEAKTVSVSSIWAACPFGTKFRITDWERKNFDFQCD